MEAVLVMEIKRTRKPAPKTLFHLNVCEHCKLDLPWRTSFLEVIADIQTHDNQCEYSMLERA